MLSISLLSTALFRIRCFLLPGDDLKNTHKPYVFSLVFSRDSFVFSLATVEIALATAIAEFLQV